MGAPIGNNFWTLRKDLTEDGRKLSVKQVKEKLSEYIERCIEDRLYERDWVGKDAIQVERPKMISMTIWGACAWLGIADVTWLEWKKDEKYTSILTRAETIFKAYNVEGASAGFLNQSIIARLEGLTEKSEVKTEVKNNSIPLITWVGEDDPDDLED
ncbi:MAG: hypothetical protein GF317_23490 [Candidatus Lokiarchaeota archaeon]|nr:hypothetical protein [Candidatus Lokiarchaeota archaeon]